MLHFIVTEPFFVGLSIVRPSELALISRPPYSKSSTDVDPENGLNFFKSMSVSSLVKAISYKMTAAFICLGATYKET